MIKGYIVLFLLFLISGLWAQNFTVEGIAYSALSANTVEVVSGGNYTGDLVIPASVRHEGVDYSVVSIKKQCFFRCRLTKVTLSNSIVSIGSSAFYQCADLQDVVLPSGLLTIGSSAFYQCTSLKNINIPSTVTVIEGAAFCECSSIESVNLSSSIKSIPMECFAGCASLRDIVIPPSVAVIYDNAFVNCSSLTMLDLPVSVTTIGTAAFSGCTGLSVIYLRSYYFSIGERAFSNCTALKKIYSGITNPGRLYDNVFYKLDKSACILYVPVGSKGLYQETDGWKAFPNIVEFDASALKSIKDFGYTIKFDSDNNVLYVDNVDVPVKIFVYALNAEVCISGNLWTGDLLSLENLDPGVYVAKIVGDKFEMYRKIIIAK